jgi:hypothetical protein
LDEDHVPRTCRVYLSGKTKDALIHSLPQSCIFRAVAGEYLCLFCSFFYGFYKKRTFFLTAESGKYILKDIELWLTKEEMVRTYNFSEEIMLILKFEPLAAKDSGNCAHCLRYI